MKTKTKKRFGQHFLNDPAVLQHLIRAAQLKPGDPVLEVGPGQGVLTEAILQTGASVQAVEIDRDLCAFLRKRFQQTPQFHLVEADVLHLDFAQTLGSEPTKLVANLPYNISTPLFFKLLKERQRFSSITLMVQKEVGDRLLHRGEKKPLKDYGILSVAANLCFETRFVCAVGPESFRPPPKVNSVVVQLNPKGPMAGDEDAFFRFLRWGFGQRRKLLLSRLNREQPEDVAQLSEASRQGLVGKRPENLTPFEWLELYQQTRPPGGKPSLRPTEPPKPLPA